MITMSPGHWKPGTGAVGIIDEVTEARKVVNRVIAKLKNMGIRVHHVEDNTSKNQRENLRYLIVAHNQTKRQLDVSIHFNAVASKQTRAIGTEVLYKKAAVRSIAARLSKGVADAAGYPDRGAKQRNDLAFLNGTTEDAVLIEICFVNSTADVSLYKKHFEAICRAIAKTLAQFIQPNSNPFSSAALYERIQKLYYDKSFVKAMVEKGISQECFSVIWREKLEKDQLTLNDFCGLCVLLLEKGE